MIFIDSDMVNKLITKALNESLDVACNLLLEYGIDYFEIFGENFSKAYAIWLGGSVFYNTTTQLLDPFEIIPENKTHSTGSSAHSSLLGGSSHHVMFGCIQ